MKIIVNCSKENTIQIFEREMKTTAVLKRNIKDQSGNRVAQTGIIVFRLWKYLKSNISREPLIDGVINDDSFRIYTLNLLPFVQNNMACCQWWFFCGTIYEESGKTILQARMKMEHQFNLLECIAAIYIPFLIVITYRYIGIVGLIMLGAVFAYEILSIILMKKCVEQMIIKDINHIFTDFGTTVSKK